MIDEYWTWQFYGYHSDELTPQSANPIVARCDECCQHRVLRYNSYRDLCLSCSHSGERHSFYGVIGAENPNWRGGQKTDVQCSMCGDIFETSKQKKEINKHHFCCRACQSQFWSIYMTAYWDDHINRERLSASIQGISYDEWEGFAIDKPYCPAFDETCRESNREKYDRQCFLCGKDESENITSSNERRKLSVHHYDMNKMAGCDNHMWKLVPLCMQCHIGAHNGLIMNRIIYLLNNVWNMA